MEHTKPETVSRGALIFAYNNEETDYLKLAAWSAKNIRKYLKIPVAVVTNESNFERASLLGFDKVIVAPEQLGGTRYFEDYQSTVSWHNGNRSNAYDLTPWDETLLLDADYVVDSSDLSVLWYADADFICHRYAADMKTGEELHRLNMFGQFDMPMWWATVIRFRKSTTTQYIFDCMSMVKNNWQHYRDLYGINSTTFRNDFALSIALGIVNGHTGAVDEIPWPLATVMPDVQITKDEIGYALEFKDSANRPKYITFTGMDFHAMGKKHLGGIIEAD